MPRPVDIMQQARGTRHTYGRGMADGLRLAGVFNTEEHMNPAKLEARTRDLNPMLSKVYAAVPILEPWAPGLVRAEMVRQGQNVSFSHVRGCLQELHRKGLVQEVDSGSYRRTAASAPHPVEKEAPVEQEVMPTNEGVEQMTKQTQPAAAPCKRPLDMLVDVAERARTIAAEVQSLVKNIENVALEVESQLQRIERDTEKMRQLQTLLKSLGDTQ